GITGITVTVHLIMEFQRQVLSSARDGKMAVDRPAFDAGFKLQGHR
ncbi:MAG: hypothetical protein RIS11_1131, partial [Pseudomonadota bacterium]